MVPTQLREAYCDWKWVVAYSYGPEVVTYRLSHPRGDVRYAKVAYATGWPSIAQEADRMRWARHHLPVPNVVESESTDSVDWLITDAIPGVDATDPSLIEQPARVVDLLARGLRRFHDTPVGACPFDFRLDAALQHVKRRAADGAIDAASDFHREHQHLSVGEAVARLEHDRPDTEDLVVCHGDYCFPNIIVNDNRAAGFVDLGELGVADRWWDLAVATWSTLWNVGPGYEEAFLEAYGIPSDLPRIAYYRLLYDLVS